MAMIKCPECGKDVSDKAKNCPNCGCPIASSVPNNTVKIRMSPVMAADGINGHQKASIKYGGDTLWEGETGEVAELTLKEPTEISINYHMSLMHYGGECSVTVDPAKSPRYNVSARQGFFCTKLVLQPVDVFDAD